MARMIDADAMLAELKPITYEMEHTSVLVSDMSNIMRNWVERQPTLTQPGTVYCQDCIHHEDGYTHWCNKWEHVCPDDSEFFCKFGRKKDGSID